MLGEKIGKYEQKCAYPALISYRVTRPVDRKQNYF